jgi:hypothetical protein
LKSCVIVAWNGEYSAIGSLEYYLINIDQSRD